MRVLSTASASWAYRPNALIGFGMAGAVGEDLEDVAVVQLVGAGLAVAAPGRSFLSSVSSQVNQVPQGVGPPAQLTAVPEMPTHSP